MKKMLCSIMIFAFVGVVFDATALFAQDKDQEELFEKYQLYDVTYFNKPGRSYWSEIDTGSGMMNSYVGFNYLTDDSESYGTLLQVNHNNQCKLVVEVQNGELVITDMATKAQHNIGVPLDNGEANRIGLLFSVDAESNGFVGVWFGDEVAGKCQLSRRTVRALKEAGVLNWGGDFNNEEGTRIVSDLVVLNDVPADFSHSKFRDWLDTKKESGDVRFSSTADK